ncbi:MAG: hypothetical protein Q9169_005295 [Polycauliona sp. 2 TL-2023]
MTMEVKSVYHDENGTMIGYHYNWPVKEIAYSESPLDPIVSENPWIFPSPRFDGFLYVCGQSRFSQLPELMATFEEELVKKSGELADAKALNNQYAKTIKSINGQRTIECAEFKGVTAELQWFSVNYPLLVAANTRLQNGTAQASKYLQDTQDELDECRNEASDLRKRLTNLTAGLTTSQARTSLSGKGIAQGVRDSSDLQAEWELAKSQKQEAVASKLKAETERDEARYNEQKAIEESSRKIANLEVSSKKANLKNQETIADLKSSIEGLEKQITGFEIEKKEHDEAIKSSNSDRNVLKARVCQMENELGENKDEMKKTEQATRSSLEKDTTIQARDATIDRLKERVKTLEAVEKEAKDLGKSSAANAESLKRTQELLRSEELIVHRLEQELKESKETVTSAKQSAAKSSHDIGNLLRDRDTSIAQLQGELATLRKAGEELGTKEVWYDTTIANLRRESSPRIATWKDEYYWHHYIGGALQALMSELNVAGNLGNQAGIEQIKHAMKGQIEASKSLYEQKVREVEHVKKQRDDLQQLKSRMESAPKIFGDRDELTKDLQEANEARRSLGAELLKYKNRSLHLGREVEKINEDLVVKTAELTSNQKRNNGYTEKVVDLNNQVTELQAKEARLRNDITTLETAKTNYEKDVQQLLERKKLLEEQRAKLVKQKCGPTGEFKDTKQSPEKRSRENVKADWENGDPRSNKQQKQETSLNPAA